MWGSMLDDFTASQVKNCLDIGLTVQTDRQEIERAKVSKPADRWETDGLKSLSFRIVDYTVDQNDCKDSGITYHRVKVSFQSSHLIAIASATFQSGSLSV